MTVAVAVGGRDYHHRIRRQDDVSINRPSFPTGGRMYGLDTLAFSFHGVAAVTGILAARRQPVHRPVAVFLVRCQAEPLRRPDVSPGCLYRLAYGDGCSLVTTYGVGLKWICFYRGG
jgi:hypothetical protein